ncbi:hypothetical protein [Streptomyces sp. MI02-7b]|uniref:hypothetical protein n=1 Tax=Streptomyces sp. MI02-7b TaxID=462941 RepID=UPI0029B431E2|nr:hypothetical protein [Streptomyces sp. MI02-7b]MDX3073474.1 hypothetical protein [Streptomyces sp. MI02-7b]
MVLVGHPYGGVVISNAASGSDKVKALVYADAFLPDKGESANDLASKAPDRAIGKVLRPVPSRSPIPTAPRTSTSTSTSPSSTRPSVRTSPRRPPP